MNGAKKAKATASKSKGNRKLLAAIVGIAAIMVIIGVIAAAAGIFSVKSTSDDISGNSALDSEEYKAVAEYNQYLDNLGDEEMEEALDTSDEAIYDAPAKVKELCKKYNLKYAAKMTSLTKYGQVEKELAERKLSNMFSDDLNQALKKTMKEYDGGYVLDDGNLYLEIEQAGDKEESNIYITINISPKGVFPWKAYSLKQTGDEQNAAAKTFNSKPKKGEEFACMVDGSESVAFGKAGDYYIFMAISRDLTEAESDAQEKVKDKIDAKIKKEIGMETLDELEEKVFSGIRAAWEKEPEAMQEALDNDDTAQYKALQKKYSKASEKETALYEECSKELTKYHEAIKVTKEDMEEYLNKIDFSEFV